MDEQPRDEKGQFASTGSGGGGKEKSELKSWADRKVTPGYRQSVRHEHGKPPVVVTKKVRAPDKADISGPALGASTQARMVSQNVESGRASHQDAIDAHNKARDMHTSEAKKAKDAGEHEKAKAHELKAQEHKDLSAKHSDKAKAEWAARYPSKPR